MLDEEMSSLVLGPSIDRVHERFVFACHLERVDVATYMLHRGGVVERERYLDLCRNRAEEDRDVAITRQVAERLVERELTLGQDGDVGGLRCGRHLVDVPSQRAGWLAQARYEPDCDRLEPEPNVVDVDDVVNAEFPDIDAAVLSVVDESLGAKAAKRVANRTPANAEFVCEPSLNELGTWCKRASDNRPADRLVGALAYRRPSNPRKSRRTAAVLIPCVRQSQTLAGCRLVQSPAPTVNRERLTVPC